MTQAELEAFVAALPNVEQTENFGYIFFFVGDDHRLPFATIGTADNEFDDVSNLNREGVFRVNIGISKATYNELLDPSDSEEIDYSSLNVFLPHPDYSRQHYICILNPTGDNAEKTKQLIVEAHSIAETRFRRKAKSR